MDSGRRLAIRKGWAMPHQQFWFPTRQDFLGLNIPTDIVDLSKMRCPREGKWRGETCGHLRPRLFVIASKKPDCSALPRFSHPIWPFD